MKKLLTGGLALLLCLALALGFSGLYVQRSMPKYPLYLGLDNYTEKITGLYLVREAARNPNTVTIFGSSELRTTNIATHPSNFFGEGRDDIYVNIVGRGSCQSIIHAMSIAASGDTLTGKKVVLITSPQSFVEGGIAPDLFTANFSEQQYFEIMLDDSISDNIKDYLSSRVSEISAEYRRLTGKKSALSAAEIHAGNAEDAPVINTLLTPYYTLLNRLFDQKDMASSARLIKDTEKPETSGISDMSLEQWADFAAEEAERMTAGNEFGILDDYYTTYIGRKLEAQRDKDKNLSYSVSKEYDDLKLLFEVCKAKGIEPLFVHVPLHGEWSDYTGFTAERRAEYYANVSAICGEYGIDCLDLTGYEYEEYFLCDIMHLGWKGWLEVDKAIIEYAGRG